MIITATSSRAMTERVLLYRLCIGFSPFVFFIGCPLLQGLAVQPLAQGSQQEPKNGGNDRCVQGTG